MTLSIFSNQNTAHLIELFLWMLGAFLIGWFFWRWWYQNKCKNELIEWKNKYRDLENRQNSTIKATKVTASGVSDPSIVASNFVDGVAKADDVKDDLTKIEGIGPKIKGLINDDGIWSFNQLAGTKVNRLQGVLDNAGSRYRIHDPSTWPAQARLAADGKWSELEKWQDELKGGVAVSKDVKSSDTGDSVKDDLTKVEGIGPKIKGLLNDDGIWSFRQLADATVERLQEILNNAGPRYRMHDPGTWPKQADLAADGKWSELEKWQDELKGGR